MQRDAGQNSNDTIVARATPRGASALSVVRLSGPGALEIAGRVFDGMNLNMFKGNVFPALKGKVHG